MKICKLIVVALYITVAADLCKQLSPQALSLCEAFDITDTMLSAPIALDWVDFNVGDNQGEV